MRTVSITFVGDASDEVAQSFYTLLIDGGLQDQVIDTLTTDQIEVEGIIDHNNESLSLAIMSKVKS